MHPWHLRGSYFDTVSVHYLRNGPAFLRFFPSRFFCSCTKLHHTMISAWHLMSSALPSSSVRQRCAVPCSNMPCRSLPRGAVLCGAVPRCAVLRDLLYLPFCACSIIIPEVPAEFNLAHQLSSAQLNSAAPCGAVPCRAVWYCAVLCRAVPCCSAVLTLSYLPGIVRSFFF